MKIALLVAAAALLTAEPPYQTADRLDQVQVTDTLPPPGGVQGKPFAPSGLSPCDEMMFYGRQFGLPERFAGIGWRESNCRNEDAVRTYCCHGYWQLYFTVNSADHRTGPRWRDECSIYYATDFNSNTAIEKQRQACGAGVLYDIVGTAPWSATR
jgi:hypothetical protein